MAVKILVKKTYFKLIQLIGITGASGEWYWWNLDGSKEKCLVAWHEKTYGKNFKYQDFATMWHAEMFNPDEWAALVNWNFIILGIVFNLSFFFFQIVQSCRSKICSFDQQTS